MAAHGTDCPERSRHPALWRAATASMVVKGIHRACGGGLSVAVKAALVLTLLIHSGCAPRTASAPGCWVVMPWFQVKTPAGWSITLQATSPFPLVGLQPSSPSQQPPVVLIGLHRHEEGAGIMHYVKKARAAISLSRDCRDVRIDERVVRERVRPTLRYIQRIAGNDVKVESIFFAAGDGVVELCFMLDQDAYADAVQLIIDTFEVRGVSVPRPSGLSGGPSEGA